MEGATMATDADAAVEQLALALQSDAVARDRAGGHAAEARALVRASGLLNLTTPVAFGGGGRSWREFHRGLRRIAQADSALAHLYAFHHLQVATVLLYGTPEQHAALLVPTVRERLFWGNALNPNDTRALARPEGDGWRIDGPKGYCSGAVGADRLTVSAWHTESGSLLIAALPADRAGVSIQHDWDAFGQKQTDSGTVLFDRVRVHAHEVLAAPGVPPTPRQTLRSQLAQLVLTSLYAGLARGALEAGLQFTRERSRPFVHSGVARATDDPYVQHRYAQLSLRVRPAEVLADHAAECVDAALVRGDALAAEERGRVAIAVAEAKVLAHQAAVEVASQIFELTGPGATSQRLGLDRFWRNARVHTLHDPVDHKLRDLGRHLLTGAWPEPTAYS